MICECCGETLTIGDFPFCPHGRAGHGIIRDEIPGGFTQTNFGHEPEVFYSQHAMLKRADQLGLRPMVRNAGPHDKHVPKWSSVDLAAATALVSRANRASDVDPMDVPLESFKMTIEAK